MKARSLAIWVIVAVLVATGVSKAVMIDWVTVGNPGNPADDTGYGSVSEVYRISAYEITAGQYTEFLNAVAATDPHGLYNPAMWSNYDNDGCRILRSGTEGNYTYSVASDWANRPVNYVSCADSLRFVNWLHNGQGTGDTENGAYDMSLGENVVREAGALVWLPSEDEWYKAAYHKNDGVTGNYFRYPTGTDSIPSNDLIDPDPGNNATYYDEDGSSTIGSPYWRTEVGAHENSYSPYGTFDMGGNVMEWNETVVMGSYRGLRGGSYGNYRYAMWASERGYSSLGWEDDRVGFRVASVPEPATLLLLALGALTLRRRK